MILKPFNLEAAKAGKPVCTRDGRPARIIAYDLKGGFHKLVVLVQDHESYEDIYTYTESGEYRKYCKNPLDLFMAPEKKEGWINLYKYLPYLHTIVDFEVYDTEQEAKDNIDKKGRYITTIKIEWEE